MNYNKILKKIEKYYLFVFYKNKITFIGKNSNKKEIFINLKKNKNFKKLHDNFDKVDIILLKISKIDFNPKQKIKMVFGPIKVDINFFILSKRGAIKTNQHETRNNHLFYTIEYLEKHKISKEDFPKIINLAVNNKLEKRLLAPKLITQIKK